MALDHTVRGIVECIVHVRTSMSIFRYTANMVVNIYACISSAHIGFDTRPNTVDTVVHMVLDIYGRRIAHGYISPHSLDESGLINTKHV